MNQRNIYPSWRPIVANPNNPAPKNSLLLALLQAKHAVKHFP